MVALNLSHPLPETVLISCYTLQGVCLGSLAGAIIICFWLEEMHAVILSL